MKHPKGGNAGSIGRGFDYVVRFDNNGITDTGFSDIGNKHL